MTRTRVNVIKNGKIVASAQNLEVINRYARTHSPIVSMVARTPYLHVKYADGARLKVEFASPTLLKRYVVVRGY